MLILLVFSRLDPHSGAYFEQWFAQINELVAFLIDREA
jgi:hypothetical protein